MPDRNDQSLGARQLQRRCSEHITLLGAIALTVTLGASCTDSPLFAIAGPAPPVFDNELKVDGDFCTTDPSSLKFPLKVVFVIDTSQSMNTNDPIDPNQPDLTQATNRSRAIRDVITQFIDITVSDGTEHCNTGDPGCARGESCPACSGNTTGGTAICVGPECWPDPNTWGGGLPACPPPGGINGACMDLCDTTKPGCGPNEKGCVDCADNDRCLNGVCGKMLDPGVEFAVIRFGSAKQVLTRDPDGNEGFTNDPQELVTALPQVNNGGSVTDYQGALAETYHLLSTDMKNAQTEGVVAMNRTKYVVIFLSDGQPDPPVTGSSDWDNMSDNIKNDLLANAGGGTDVIIQYNVPETILRRVQDIMSLKILYRVGDIRMHTAFLSSPNMPTWNQDKATSLLKQMATMGKGTFRNFRNGEELNFLHVDFSSLRRVFKLKNFIATNVNGRPYGAGTITDSDGDGLDDALEFASGTHLARVDTDLDGFSDTLEHFFRTSGWDPLDPTDADCNLHANDADGDGKIDDTDGDSLADCEERFIGTNRHLFDSDADGIPDGVEVRFGTNPVANDVLADLDFDGMPNGDEIRLHTDPSADDAAYRSRQSYRYDVVRTGNGIEPSGTQCRQDDDCPQKTGCTDGFCRCTDAMQCSSLTSCTDDIDCTYGDEKCIDGRCLAEAKRCEAFARASGAELTCVEDKFITCYRFEVENIQLVTPTGVDPASRGWNTIFLYFGEAPFDNPDGQGNFKVACAKARYNTENGFKLPATARIRVPINAWRSPQELNPQTDCVCPDGSIGDCISTVAP